MHFHHVLFPVDFSAQCEHAVGSVLQFSAELGSQLTLLHVVDLPYAWSGEIDPALLSGHSWDELVSCKRQELEEFRNARFAGPQVQAVCRKGDPAQVISEFASSGGTDVIMMPTHGHGRFRAALLGSVTAKVIHDTSCPVWTSAHTDAPSNAARPCERIICAVDETDRSIDTIECAGSLADNLKSSLMLVHVIRHADAACESGARARIQELQRAANVSLPVCIAAGRVEEAVTQAAKGPAADLVVIGRGRSSEMLGSFLSHVYGIIRHSPCPVMTV